MTIIIEDGWLFLDNDTDDIRLACEKIKADFKLQPKIKHYSGGGHMGYSLGKRWIVVKAFKILLDTHTKLADLMDNILSWQDSGSFDLRISRDGGSSNFVKINGTNTTYPVMIAKDGIRGIEDLEAAAGETYQLEMIIFEQTDDAHGT